MHTKQVEKGRVTRSNAKKDAKLTLNREMLVPEWTETGVVLSDGCT